MIDKFDIQIYKSIIVLCCVVLYCITLHCIAFYSILFYFSILQLYGKFEYI